MTTNTTPEAPRNYSLAIRWIAATAIVFTVGLGGFLLRGDDSQRREPSPPPTTRQTPADHGALFPEVPDLPAVDVGMGMNPEPAQSSGESTLADFAACDEPARPLPSKAPSSWTRYASSPNYSYSVDFKHPADWDVVEEGEQIAAVSPDGARAFVVEVVPFPDATTPMRDVLSTMQNATSRRYSDARSVVIDGKDGCAATASGDGHSGQIVLLRGDGVIAVLTAGHDVDPDEATIAEAWALIGSVRIGG